MTLSERGDRQNLVEHAPSFSIPLAREAACQLVVFFACSLSLPCLRARAQSDDAAPSGYREAVAAAIREYEAQSYAEAREQFRRAHRLFPNARTLRGLGVTEYELHNYPEAVRYLERALASEVSRDGVKHPIFPWAGGSGTAPGQHQFHLVRWASHGFVVAASSPTGNGSEHKNALDWLLEQNAKSDSPYYQKLNTARIAAGGHSQGSLSTFAFANDARLSTTIHVSGGTFDGIAAAMLRKPAAFLCGEMDGATVNCASDYTKATVPVFYTVIAGTDHLSTAREGLPAIVSWLRWHLNGETDRKSQFVGASCEFCTGKYTSMSKGW